MQLRPDVTRLNILSVFAICAITALLLYLKTSMYSYLLAADYGVSKHDSATVAATLAFITDFVVIPFEFIFGGAMDMFGRKWMTVASLIFTGSTLVIVTFGTVVYPYLLCFTMVLGVSLVPIMLQPFWLDYIDPSTQGA